MLGAVGVNLGTRFIASTESPAPIEWKQAITTEWKQAITTAKSEEAIKVEALNDISPLPGTAGYGTVLRSLPTAFLDEWSAKRGEARKNQDRLRGEIVLTTQAGRPHACLLTAGQTAAGIRDIPRVGEIVPRARFRVHFCGRRRRASRLGAFLIYRRWHQRAVRLLARDAPFSAVELGKFWARAVDGHLRLRGKNRSLDPNRWVYYPFAQAIDRCRCPHGTNSGDSK
jgi:hypothetical protein